MKKVKMIGLMMLMSISTVMINGCTKDGATGPAGATGAQGKPGNANVINHSITIKPGDWKYSASYKQWYYDYPCTDNSNSAVMGYVMSGNGEQVLPYTDITSNSRCQMSTYLFGTPPYIEFQYVNLNSFTTAPSFDQYLYLVIIPPVIMKTRPDVNYHSYEAVKVAFNLKD